MQREEKIKTVREMDSFKLYLPSNACENIYPNNTSTAYKTRFDHAIDLSGEWEVGVESIFYDPNFDYTNEKVKIYVNTTTVKKYLANDTNRFKYLLTKEGKWKGFIGIKPNEFETDPNKFDGVLKTLNSMNSLMLETGQAFRFDKNSSVKDFDSELYMTITSRLAEVIGFKGDLIFNGNSNVQLLDRNRKPGEGKLTADDYLLKYLSTNVQRREARIELKPQDMSFDGGENSLLGLWTEKTRKFGAIRARIKNHKFIIDNYSKDLAVVFSPDFAKVIGHDMPILGKGTTWAQRAIKLDRDYTSQAWYIDIYSTELRVLEEKKDHQFVLNVYPKQYESVKAAMKHVTDEVKRQLKEKLKTEYDVLMHRFELKLSENGYTKLVLGRDLGLHFSPIFHYLFALPRVTLRGTEIHGTRHIGDTLNLDRQLFILSNVAKTTALGKSRLPILQSFIHKAKKRTLIEKRFEPIVYLPLMTNYIDMIEIQLVNTDYEPVKIADSKTVLCLYFRKLRERTMM